MHRLKRQDQLEKAPDMKPWAEMGMKYGWLGKLLMFIHLKRKKVILFLLKFNSCINGRYTNGNGDDE